MKCKTGTISKLWNRFWFKETSLERLGLLRITFGIILCIKMTEFHFLYGYSIHFPANFFSTPDDYFLDDFRLPYPGLSWLPFLGYEHYPYLESAILLLGMLLTLGLFTRVVAPLAAILFLYRYLPSQFMYRHNVFMMANVLVILACSRCGDFLSLDRKWRGKKTVSTGPILPLRLMQVLVTLIYFFSFAIKAKSGVWLNGRMSELLLAQGFYNGPAGTWIHQWSPHGFIGAFTVLSEGFLCWGLWIPRLRKFAIATGVLLHFSIDMAGYFGFVNSYMMMAFYIAFGDFDHWDQTFSTVRRTSKRRLFSLSALLAYCFFLVISSWPSSSWLIPLQAQIRYFMAKLGIESGMPVFSQTHHTEYKEKSSCITVLGIATQENPGSTSLPPSVLFRSSSCRANSRRWGINPLELFFYRGTYEMSALRWRGETFDRSILADVKTERVLQAIGHYYCTHETDEKPPRQVSLSWEKEMLSYTKGTSIYAPVLHFRWDCFESRTLEYVWTPKELPHWVPLIESDQRS